MASQLTIPLLILSFLALTTAAYSAPPKPSNFVKNTCQVTRYPALCIQSLGLYSTTIKLNHKRMAQVALTVSLSKARFAQAYVIKVSKSKGLKAREYQVMKDCVDNMIDSVDWLNKSLGELRVLRGKYSEEGFNWHMSNVQTWVSAALTDDSTCMDGFGGRAMDGKLKTAIRARITGVAQVTSNALALVNCFADKHQDEHRIQT